jgi:hypothetical protein
MSGTAHESLVFQQLKLAITDCSKNIFSGSIMQVEADAKAGNRPLRCAIPAGSWSKVTSRNPIPRR